MVSLSVQSKRYPLKRRESEWLAEHHTDETHMMWRCWELTASAVVVFPNDLVRPIRTGALSTHFPSWWVDRTVASPCVANWVRFPFHHMFWTERYGMVSGGHNHQMKRIESELHYRRRRRLRTRTRNDIKSRKKFLFLISFKLNEIIFKAAVR